jgi:hypothetical protein
MIEDKKRKMRRWISLEGALKKIEQIVLKDGNSDVYIHVCFLKWHKIRTMQEVVEGEMGAR